MVLQHICELVNIALVRLGPLRLHLDEKHLVRLDDLKQLVRQVIFRALVVLLHNRGTHLRRRDSHDGTDHPVRAAPTGIKSHEGYVLIRNTTKEALDVLHL